VGLSLGGDRFDTEDDVETILGDFSPAATVLNVELRLLLLDGRFA
jgi:hypothetical protein